MQNSQILFFSLRSIWSLSFFCLRKQRHALTCPHPTHKPTISLKLCWRYSSGRLRDKQKWAQPVTECSIDHFWSTVANISLYLTNQLVVMPTLITLTSSKNSVTKDSQTKCRGLAKQLQDRLMHGIYGNDLSHYFKVLGASEFELWRYIQTLKIEPCRTV